MNYEEFLAPFHSDSRQSDLYEGSQAETLEAADRWSDFFSDSLYDLLDDNVTSTNPQELVTRLVTYLNWSQRELPAIQQSVLKVKSERSAGLANRLNFHELNRAFGTIWYRLLTGNGYQHSAESRAEKTLVQNLLALGAIGVLKLRESVPIDEYYARSPDRNLDPRRKTYEGILTEFDTAIVLLEAIKDDPNLIVVPSPNLFEHGEKRELNSDFLLIDSVEQEVVGVQCKSTLTNGDMNRYDSSRVVLVEGATDFDNVSHRKGRLRKVAATAGLISTAQLLHMPTHGGKLEHGAVPFHDNRNLLQAKLYARQVVANTSHRSIKMSADRIGTRLTHALYQTEASSTQLNTVK